MADWNQASDEIQTGSGPESRNWAIRHLVADFPNRAGVPDRTEEVATLIVDALLGKPYPGSVGWADAENMVAVQVVNYANENGFLFVEWARTGWIDREGKVYTCTYAAHEKLLYNVLGMNTAEAEGLGWVRSDHRHWRCRFKLSKQQEKVLRKMDHVVDPRVQKELPVWTENRNSIKP